MAVFDLHLDKAQKVVEEVSKLGGKACAIQCDVGFSDQVARAFAEADRQLGGLDILVNNAGLIRQSPIVEMPEEDWDFILRNNLKSVFLCSKRPPGG